MLHQKGKSIGLKEVEVKAKKSIVKESLFDNEPNTTIKGERLFNSAGIGIFIAQYISPKARKYMFPIIKYFIDGFEIERGMFADLFPTLQIQKVDIYEGMDAMIWGADIVVNVKSGPWLTTIINNEFEVAGYTNKSILK